MPRRKFDRKTAQTFALVHRAQNDPLMHDASVSSMVFKELAPPQSHKIKHRADLEEEFGGNSIRANEGEAANYGVYFDDTEYDYMQHIRDLGTNGDAYFVEVAAKERGKKGKGKEKMRLEDALAAASLDDDGESEGGVSLSSAASGVSVRELLGQEVLPSDLVTRRTYQDQQDVPDALAGFQPDMDPRLREVLEALEDEAYVDDEDDFFAELAGDGEEVDQEEWDDAGWEEDMGGAGVEEDGGWETDDTIKPDKESKPANPVSSTATTTAAAAAATDLPAPDAAPADALDHGDGAWLAEFSKFKKDAKSAKAAAAAAAAAPTHSDLQSSILTGTSVGRRKKRKGALTSNTGYSMTSSALFRTENQSLLDARFDKIEEEYADEDDFGYSGDADDGVSLVSGMSGLSRTSGLSKASGMSGMSKAASEAPSLVRQDFDAIMDDFLGAHSTQGKRGRIKKSKAQTGLEQLDEIRQGLGPARLRAEKA